MVVRVSPRGPAMNLSRVQPRLRPEMAALTPTPPGTKSVRQAVKDGWIVELLLMDLFSFKTVVSDFSLFPRVYFKQLASTMVFGVAKTNRRAWPMKYCLKV